MYNILVCYIGMYYYYNQCSDIKPEYIFSEKGTSWLKYQHNN